MTIPDKILGALRRLRKKSPPVPLLSPEEMQRQFTAKSRCYRDLLTANSNVLETMAEMEKTLQDGRTLSMTFIRAKCTAMAVNVYKIIHNLIKLSDGRYVELQQVFARLQQEIDDLLSGESSPVAGALILPLERISRKVVDLTGEKMANLGEAGTLPGIHIPPGFAVTSAATRLFFHYNKLYPAINHVIQQLDITDLADLHNKSAAIQRKISACRLPPELEAQLYQHYDALAAATTPEVKVAVRSSALGEDLGQASFAGLYHTELQVDREQLVAAYKSVLASKYSPRAISYRLAKGYRHEETEMCVGCLVMIEAVWSGICYSRSIGGRLDTLDLFFAGGSAKGIVDGTRTTSHFLIERAPPHRIAHRSPAPEHQEALLDDAQATALAALAMNLETHFGVPQDIEWSIDRTGTIHVLQSRPISAPSPVVATGGPAVIDEERLILRGGVTGCGGVGCGPVALVETTVDLLRFPNRAVLVVRHPLPEWAPLLKRAVALVAETGSEAGHLATLSREFGLPALLAVNQATERLVNGEIITVDATHQALYRGRVEELLIASAPKPNPMAGSPVQKTLVEVLKRITPLYLTNPAAPEFRAINCRTMHDITRFCHEQSVNEMFDFGQRRQFDAGAAKRLVDTLPLEWWVINLGDGFHPRYDVRADTIAITDIVSVPMLALWEGMHAVAWEGPPVARLRTMLSFLFQSAVQSGLDPSRSSALMQKNYFLISKNYCNLSVRLGYHYAMIEALTNGRVNDRYLTFRFKGGAAGEDQRVQRIELLAEILAKFDFRIDRIGDALTARVERGTEKFLYDRLKVLGYLTIHTRQIDMVLADAGERRFFCDKFIDEIEEMLTNDH